MYKIMLADDEGIVIDSLKFIIEKEFKDTCEVQYAKTGRSVIELAESFRDRKSTRLNSSHQPQSRMPSSA